MLRKGLVVFQFVITITLISSIFIIQEQLSFIRNKPLGFKDEGAIMIPVRTREATSAIQTLQSEFLSIPGVKSVAFTNSLPSTPQFSDWLMYTEGSTYDKAILSRAVNVSEHYFETMGIDLIAGRDVIFPADTFSFKTLHNKIIINEAGLKAYGLDINNAVGQKLYADWETGEKSSRDHWCDSKTIIIARSAPPFPSFRTIYVLPTENSGLFIHGCIDRKVPTYQEVSAKMKEAWDKIIITTPFDSQPLSSSGEAIRKRSAHQHYAVDLNGAGDHHLVYGSLRPVDIRSRKKSEGDWYSQGPRRIR